jgi:hypothetical protein
MSATPQDVTSQINQIGNPVGQYNPQAFGGQSIDWQQMQQLVTPPPLPDTGSTLKEDAAQTVADADADTADSGPPPGPPIKAPPAPLTQEQVTSTAADEMAAGKEQQKVDQAIIDRVKSGTQKEADLSAEYLKSLEQYAPPTPPQPDVNPLQRLTPLLFLAAFGGKLTKADANAMLAATNGTIQGYLKGDQQKFENSVKQYDMAYDQYKDRRANQKQIYDTLRDSYAGMVDGDIRALQAMHEMTGDRISADQKLLDLQEHWEQMSTQLALHNQEMSDRRYNQRANLHFKQLANDRAQQAANGKPGDQMTDDELRTAAEYAVQGGKDPSFGLGKNSTRDRYNKIKAEVIATAGGARAAVGESIATKAATTEANQVARREAAVLTALTPLTQTGGLFDQVKDKAAKVNWGDSLIADKIQLGVAKNIYANKDIANYIQVMRDVQQEISTAYARGGQQTDLTRSLANDAFPIVTSRSVLDSQITTATQVIGALNSGNRSVLNSIISGLPFKDAAKLSQTGGGQGQSISADELKAYAKKQGKSVDAARAFLQSQGYTVQ